jgi:hypothetical protein
MNSGIYSGYSSNRTSATGTEHYTLLNQFHENVYQSFTINIFIPLYDRMNRINRKRGRINQNIDLLKQKEVEEKVASRYLLSRKNLINHLQKFSSATNRFKAEIQIFESCKAKYETGRLSISEHTKAKLKVIEAEKEYINSFFKAYHVWKDFQIDYFGELTY